VQVGERYAVWGYSQGGHGAAWANEISEEWAPELELAGTVAGAPPSEMGAIFSALATTPLSPDFFFMIVAGYAEAYPDADPAAILTPAGVELLDKADDGCFGMGEAMAGRPMSDFVKPDFAQADAWTTRLAENDPGHTVVDAPLLILHSAADDIVPAGLSAAMFARMCDNGQVVERRVYDKGHGHGAAVPDAVTDGFTWIEGVMSGEKPAISTC
jgi:pimeloyl-ACP methyl ester carboxylesterase